MTDNLYKLLNDDLIMREAIWQLSLYLEHFNCKNNQVPCQGCRSTAAKLAPLFLFTIDVAATKTFHHPRSLASMILAKIGEQKWQITRPWRPFSIPILKEIEVPVKGKTLFDEPKKEPAVTYKLVKRQRGEGQ